MTASVGRGMAMYVSLFWWHVLMILELASDKIELALLLPRKCFPECIDLTLLTQAIKFNLALSSKVSCTTFARIDRTSKC